MTAMGAVIGGECPPGCELLGGLAVTANHLRLGLLYLPLNVVVFCPKVPLICSRFPVLCWFRRCHRTPFLSLDCVLLISFFVTRTDGAKWCDLAPALNRLRQQSMSCSYKITEKRGCQPFPGRALPERRSDGQVSRV